MGFETAVSGLRAASTNLSIIGNNVANASTTGFKSSRGDFADVYATAGITRRRSGSCLVTAGW